MLIDPVPQERSAESKRALMNSHPSEGSGGSWAEMFPDIWRQGVWARCPLPTFPHPFHLPREFRLQKGLSLAWNDKGGGEDY